MGNDLTAEQAGEVVIHIAFYAGRVLLPLFSQRRAIVEGRPNFKLTNPCWDRVAALPMRRRFSPVTVTGK